MPVGFRLTIPNDRIDKKNRTIINRWVAHTDAAYGIHPSTTIEFRLKAPGDIFFNEVRVNCTEVLYTYTIMIFLKLYEKQKKKIKIMFCTYTHGMQKPRFVQNRT